MEMIKVAPHTSYVRSMFGTRITMQMRMRVSPDPSELPMPPQKWLKTEDDDYLMLLDLATEKALEYYWKDKVKASQYAIFNMC